jgi:hypothetical protein
LSFATNCLNVFVSVCVLAVFKNFIGKGFLIFPFQRWTGILFGKFWFAWRLAGLANVYDCEGLVLE